MSTRVRWISISALIVSWAVASVAPIPLAPASSTGLIQHATSPNVALADALACNQWNIVPSPNPATAGAGLVSVAASASNNVWAVGSPFLPGFAQQTLAERWDGSSWSIVSTPSPDPAGSIFQAVATIAADNVWAVGFNESDPYSTLVQHWDGSGWTVVPSPNAGTGINMLAAVSAHTGDDMWAVGEYRDLGGAPQTLVEHWDGSSWTVIPSPNVAASNNYLTSVVAVAADDVWAAGYYYNDAEWNTLIEHWDGSSWSIVPSPNTGVKNNTLFGLSAISPNDIWAAGTFIADGQQRTLIQHWDGSSWSIVPTPNVAAVNNMLYGISAAGADDVWAAGYTIPDGGSPQQTLILHWDGSDWSIVPSPNFGDSSRLTGIVSVPGTDDVWAVGDYTAGGGHYTMVEHYCRAPEVLTLTPAADTYVQSGSANRNVGAVQIMRVQANGDNRALMRFDQTAIQTAIGDGSVINATLRLTITANNSSWGPTGRTIDLHRLLVAWVEGNGTETSRGAGAGATWNCAADSDIADQGKDCSGVTEWEMGQPNNPSVHPWAPTPTATMTITNGMTGVIEFDVTSDVVAFLAGTYPNDGWLLRKTDEGQSGTVTFSTKESGTPAQLVITYNPAQP